jgi:hypothetical protein
MVKMMDINNNVVGKPDERPKRRWEDEIMFNFKETRCNILD